MNIELFDRPIAYHRCFVTITGSVTTAVLLSQAVYWNNRATLPDGWFWKTQDEWFDETGLSRWEQEGARKVLKKMGILNEKLEGIPAKLYYQINVKKLLELIQNTPANTPKTGCNPSKSQHEEKPHTSMRKTSILDEVKTTYRNEEKPHTNTESTTEITSEITSERKPARAKKTVEIPEWINRAAWEEFEQHRQDIKKSLTDLARTKAMKKLEGFSYNDQQAIIDYSIEGSYMGLFPDCLERQRNNNNNGRKQKEEIDYKDMTWAEGLDNYTIGQFQ
jgi:hypothetical protein